MATRTVKFVNKENGLLLDSNLFGNKTICLTHSQLNEKCKFEPSEPLTKSQQWLIDDEGVITNCRYSNEALTYDPANSQPLCLRPISKTDHQKWVRHENGLLECLGDSNDSFLQGKPDFREGSLYGLEYYFPNQEITNNVEYQPLEDLTKKRLQLDEQWDIRYVDNDELCNDLLKAKPKQEKPQEQDTNITTSIINYKKVEKISMPTGSLGPMQKSGDFDFVLPDSKPDIPVEDIRLQSLTFRNFQAWVHGGIWFAPQLGWIDLKKPNSLGIPGPIRTANHYGYRIRPDQYITKITGLWLRSRIAAFDVGRVMKSVEITAFGTLNLLTNDGASYGCPDDHDREEGTIYRHPLISECRVGARIRNPVGGTGDHAYGVIEKVIPITLEAPQGHEIISLYGTFTEFYGFKPLANTPWRLFAKYIGTLGIYTRPVKN